MPKKKKVNELEEARRFNKRAGNKAVRDKAMGKKEEKKTGAGRVINLRKKRRKK